MLCLTCCPCTLTVSHSNCIGYLETQSTRLRAVYSPATNYTINKNRTNANSVLITRVRTSNEQTDAAPSDSPTAKAVVADRTVATSSEDAPDVVRKKLTSPLALCPVVLDGSGGPVRRGVASAVRVV